MDTSFWSQPESVFSSQYSVFSHTMECSPDHSTPSPGELSLPWIDADNVRISWMTTDSLDRDGRNVAMPESVVNAWNRIRLAMAIAPFQTMVRPTCEDRFASKVVSDDKSPASAFSHVGPLSRRFDPSDPQLYVRPRCFAPTLGRFMPRDPQ